MTIFLIIAGVLSVFALLLSDLGWNNVLSSERNDLVFQDRNRAYGAYPLRREHHRVMVLAFGAAIALFGTALGVPKLIPRGPEVLPPVLSADTVTIEILPVEQPVKVVHQEVQPEQQRNEQRDEGHLVAKDSVVHDLPKDTLATSNPNDHPAGGGSGHTPADTLAKGGGGGHPEDPDTGPRSYAQVMPAFPGGDAGLQRFWANEVHFEPWMLGDNKKAVVYIEFTIDVNGKVAAAKVAGGASPDLDREVMRAVHRMPDWTPGRQGDHPVAVRFTQPVRFTVMR